MGNLVQVCSLYCLFFVIFFVFVSLASIPNVDSIVAPTRLNFNLQPMPQTDLQLETCNQGFRGNVWKGRAHACEEQQHLMQTTFNVGKRSITDARYRCEGRALHYLHQMQEPLFEHHVHQM